MTKKTKYFKCHICGAFILTGKRKVKCESCENEYALKGGKFYRENVYSKAYSKG